MSLFKSFIMGGFECSSHRLGNGKRLDVIGATQHDKFAFDDYRQLQKHGVHSVRDGIRWPLIETSPYHYDFSSVEKMIRAARKSDTQVIWDIFHYGWPDDLDIYRPEFVKRYASLAKAFAKFVRDETDEIPFYTPINEISFFSWGGGDVGYLNPFSHGRGFELKVQLAHAAIEGIEAIWSVDPRARIVHAEPVIHIVTDPHRPHERDHAEGHRQSQYQAWDLISGRLWPQIGGQDRYLDILGLNYYANNQWIHGGPPIDRHHHLYRPFRSILHEIYDRYQRPLFIAETGTENELRPDWLRYIGHETRAAIGEGVPVEGICLYPILNHPGWDDERHCHNGLLDYADENGLREPYEPLAREVQFQLDLYAQQARLRSPIEALV